MVTALFFFTNDLPDPLFALSVLQELPQQHPQGLHPWSPQTKAATIALLPDCHIGQYDGTMADENIVLDHDLAD